MELKRYGTDYGGFYYPVGLPGLNSKSNIYCVGVGEDISHDLEVASTTGAPVYLMDPTPRSIEHVAQVKQALESRVAPPPDARMGGGDPDYWQRVLRTSLDPSLIKFDPSGLSNTGGTAEFYLPDNPEYVSHSLVKGMPGKIAESIVVPIKTIHTAMKENGHSTVDLIKLDIEGVECEVLNDMMASNILPTYISVDFDIGRTGTRGRQAVELCVRKLMMRGYTVLHEFNYDMSFYKSA